MRAATRFAAHGQMQFSVSGNLLITRAEGPGNLEMIAEYQQAIQRPLADLATKPWGNMVVLSGLPMLTPDGAELLQQLLITGAASNLVVSALVFSEDSFGAVSQRFLSAMYERAGIPYRFFDDETDALNWLHEYLAN